MHDAIERYWRELVGAMEAMPFGLLSRAADTLLDCHARGGTIFVVGNGGSAATASHFACDLAKGTLAQGVPAFRVVALTDNVPLLTAWANDTSYDRVFAAQLASAGARGRRAGGDQRQRQLAQRAGAARRLPARLARR